MKQLATIALAVVFALNGGVAELPLEPEAIKIMQWLFGALLAGLGAYVGPDVVEAIKKTWSSPPTE